MEERVFTNLQTSRKRSGIALSVGILDNIQSGCLTRISSAGPAKIFFLKAIIEQTGNFSHWKLKGKIVDVR